MENATINYSTAANEEVIDAVCSRGGQEHHHHHGTVVPDRLKILHPDPLSQNHQKLSCRVGFSRIAPRWDKSRERSRI